MITLGWPPRTLHPNARVHWAARAKAARKARRDGYFATLEAGIQGSVLPAGKLHLWITFYPPDKRRRDDDGLLSSFKPYRDGIADALGIDDFNFVSHPMISDTIRRGGEVSVKITGWSKG